MITIFGRLKLCEEKLDAICQHYNISLEEHPKFKVIENNDSEMGFTIKKEAK